MDLHISTSLSIARHDINLRRVFDTSDPDEISVSLLRCVLSRYTNMARLTDDCE